jgi:hypothetical protein
MIMENDSEIYAARMRIARAVRVADAAEERRARDAYTRLKASKIVEQAVTKSHKLLASLEERDA